MNLEEQKEFLIKEFEEIYNIRDFIEAKIEHAENRALDPYSEYGFEYYLEKEFNCNVLKEHENYKKIIRKKIGIIDKKIQEKEKYCTEFIDKKCNKCGNKEKEQRKCIINMNLIDGWW